MAISSSRRTLWIAVTLVVAILIVGVTSAFLVIGFRMVYAKHLAPENGEPQPQLAETVDRLGKRPAAQDANLARRQQPEKKPTWRLQETELAKREHNVLQHLGFSPSPDHRHLAYVHRLGFKLAVALDGVSGKPYEAIPFRPTFSPDGKRVAYVIQPGLGFWTGMQVVVDGVESKLYEHVLERGKEPPILFSPDGRRFAFVATRRGEESRFMIATRTGTAFVISADGYLLTCAHVIQEASAVTVALGGGSYTAAVVAEDRALDLALLKIDAKDLPALPLGDSHDVELGMDVRAFGFPLASVLGDNLSTTRGTLSGFPSRASRRLFQIDAAINAGNSGGPLVNERGEVIGIVNLKIAGPAVSNIAMAIPADQASDMLRKHQIRLAAKPAPQPEPTVALVRRVKPAIALVKAAVRQPAPAFTSVNAMVVMGETEGEPCPGLWRPDPVFSPDGRLAYVARIATPEGTRECVVIDGKSGPKFAAIDTRLSKGVLFSPDGKRVAYFVREGPGTGVLRLILDGQSGPALLHAGSPATATFSPDGSRLAYHGTTNKASRRTVAVIDGKESAEEYDAITGPIVFSPDSRQTAFVGQRNGTQMVVLDGLTQKSTEATIRGLVFSPDSKHLAYRLVHADGSGTWGSVIVDGKEENESVRAAVGPDIWSPTLLGQGSDSPVFSPDSQHLAYIGFGPQFSVVRDGVAGKKYAAIWGLTYSADSQHLAYVALRAGRLFGPARSKPSEIEWIVVVDGVEARKRYRMILGTPQSQALFFSPDSRHLAYAALEDEPPRPREFHVVVDDFESKGFRDGPLVPLMFDGPDAMHTLVGTRRIELKIAD